MEMHSSERCGAADDGFVSCASGSKRWRHLPTDRGDPGGNAPRSPPPEDPTIPAIAK